jgi:cell division septation protein DedD
MVGRLFARVALISACLVLIAVLGAMVLGPSQQVGEASQVSTAIGIDADPTGNEAVSLGQIDACVSVGAGETFDVDIFITDVVNLKGWQATLEYEPSVLRVVDADVEFFLAGAQRGRILNLSEALPDQTGRYDFIVADMTPDAPGHSGSGVLTRVTLEAVGTGTSFLTLDGIFLADPMADPIGDVTGDSIFDGAVGYAQVWVGEPCPSPLPTPTPKPTPTVGPTATTPPSAVTPTPPPPTMEPTQPAPTMEPTQPAPATPSGGGDNGSFPWAIVLAASTGAVVVALALGFAAGRLVQRG